MKAMMMFAKLVTALSFLFLGTTAEKFQLKLVPAPDFHLATGCCLDDPIFYMRVADSTTMCENQTLPGREEPTTVCIGSFFVNLGLYDGIEFSFQAPQEEEVFIQSDEHNRVEFQFQAYAERFCVAEDYTEVDGSNIATSFIGSDVDSLETLWNPEQSGAIVAMCEIFGTFQIGGQDDSPSFTAQGSKMSWSFEYDSSLFEDLTIEFFYDTQGYTWIRTPFDNALVDAPTLPPSPTTSGGRINSLSVIVLAMGTVVLFGMLGIASVSI